MVATYVPGPNGPIVLALSATPATWSSSDKGTGITLSNGNLTATYTGAFGSHYSVRSTTSHNSGKFYLECLMGIGAAGGPTLGVGDSGFNINNSPGFIGGSNYSVGYQSSGAVTRNDGTVVTTYATFVAGDVVCLAVDIDARLIWWRVNGGNWNNSGAANPATGAGGFDISTVLGALFVAFGGVSQFSGGDIGTINFGGSAYAQAAPAGFGNW